MLSYAGPALHVVACCAKITYFEKLMNQFGFVWQP
jgi:hypothetical protein